MVSSETPEEFISVRSSSLAPSAGEFPEPDHGDEGAFQGHRHLTCGDTVGDIARGAMSAGAFAD